MKLLVRTRLAAPALILALVAISACGSDDQSTTSQDSVSPQGSEVDSVDTTADTTADTTGIPDTAAPSDLPPEGRGTVTENADGSRTVVSTWGETVVPADPQRIVSLIGDVDFEAMLALGVTPIAAGTQGGSATSGFSPHIDPALTADVTPLAWTDGAPYEEIAALEPDLIFAPDQETYDLLSEIAPTVPRGTWTGDEWKDDFVYVGEVLGLADDATSMVADYEQRVEEISTQLADTIAGVTVASPQVSYDDSGVSIAGPDQFSSAILTELGFTLAPVVSAGDGWSTELSYERLPDIDADILFWQVRQDENGNPNTEALSNVEDNPLWSQLPAVQADQVYFVDNRPWYFPTILGAQRILDDVEAALLDR
ncbi:MAG: iron-siderophore ABC transporter substrate-binding protein [Ilumatobacteraceae bacterium]